MEKQILIANEVAGMLRIDRQRVYELVRQGAIPSIRLGERQIRFSRQAIEKFIADGGNQNAGGEDEK